jgi:hypothetical protein
MQQKLAVNDVVEISEPEPAIVEIVLALTDGSRAKLRMSAFTLQQMLSLMQRSSGM